MVTLVESEFYNVGLDLTHFHQSMSFQFQLKELIPYNINLYVECGSWQPLMISAYLLQFSIKGAGN